MSLHGSASQKIDKILESSTVSVIKTGDDALNILVEGNARFVKERPTDKNLGSVKRRDLLRGQNPFAIILSCSDSRVPPEIIFDQGLGDLFVIRVAGNINDTMTLGSIEFAAKHLQAPLLVVMGHSDCGAVKATLEGGDLTPSIGAIASKIWPSVEVAISRNSDEALILEDAIVENVRSVLRDIKTNSRVIKELVVGGIFRAVGAKYNLETGKVDFFK